MKVAKNSKGIALFSAIIFAITIGVFLMGLYMLFTSLFRGTEEKRTFVSVREAASSGARYGASMTNFPVEWEENTCQTFRLDFRIAGRDEVGENEIIVCRIASVDTPGQEISGASREPVTGSAQGRAVFKITSIARFPAGPPTPLQQVSRVEAVYIR